MTKLIVYFYLVSVIYSLTVNIEDKCNDCSQLKSMNDCQYDGKKNFNFCTWDKSTDQCKAFQKLTYKSYCEQVQTESCSKIKGCAYIDSKCINFTGCSTYKLKNNENCQKISIFCINDGAKCIDIGKCSDYNQQQCQSVEITPEGKQCIWIDEKGCKEVTCDDNDSLTTNEQCSQWLKGCISRGKGCWTSPLPSCNTYRQGKVKCSELIGQDGNCELATNSNYCQARTCNNASMDLNTDEMCNQYQKGCKTTGKGCVEQDRKLQCQEYFGDKSTCTKYIGIDGICDGNQGSSNCRLRRCEDGYLTTDELCKAYQFNCVSNGKFCVQYLNKCDSYRGNDLTCQEYKGSDGYCKGVVSTSDLPCLPKVCEDAPKLFKTDEECSQFQIDCITTGNGCSTKQNMKSCQDYIGDLNTCLSLIGKEGKCTWVSGNYCIVRNCELAPTYMESNNQCIDYFSGCLSTGNGCVKQTSCDQTEKQISCQGTNNCNWQSLCFNNNDCSNFKNKSICVSNQAKVKVNNDNIENDNPIYVLQKCIWVDNRCKKLECSDLQGIYYNNDYNCQNAYSECISNRRNACITKYDCNQLKGTQDMCLNYPGYCNNTPNASVYSSCIARQCSDINLIIEAGSLTCEYYLPQCIYNGSQCVHYSTRCTSMRGTQEQCSQLIGYLSGSQQEITRILCYNYSDATSNSFCIQRECFHAEVPKGADANYCNKFLDGCVYNGNGGCVDPLTATCESYYGDYYFCEMVIVGQNGPKYCYGKQDQESFCQIRNCQNNQTATSDEQCKDFKSDCIAQSNGGCVDNTITCVQQFGTISTCQNYSGSISFESKLVQCTSFDYCQNRQCSDIIAIKGTDCINYKSTCRYYKTESSCIDAQDCNRYYIPYPDGSNFQKLEYCLNIKDKNGLLCGWNKGEITCSNRTCEQFQFNIGNQICNTYLIKNISTFSDETCTFSSYPFCYSQNKIDCSYDIQFNLNTEQRIQFCLSLRNTNGLICSYQLGDVKCSLQNTCEKIYFQQAVDCNQRLGYKNGICQSFFGCISLQQNCFQYIFQLEYIPDFQRKVACESLKVISDINSIGQGNAQYRYCTWLAGNTCSEMTCRNIQNSRSQKDCDNYGIQCYYFNGKCYEELASCPTTFPNDAYSDSLKSLYCRSMFIGYSYCELSPDKTTCQPGSNTSCYIEIPTTGTWDGMDINYARVQYCGTQTKIEKRRQCYFDYNDFYRCQEGDCRNIPNPSNQNDCDNHLKDCLYFNFKCWPYTQFNNCYDTWQVPFEYEIQILPEQEKILYCQNYKSQSNLLSCTYEPNISNSCQPALRCENYNNYCLIRIDDQGRKCLYSENLLTCRSQNCSDIFYPQSQIDCDIKGVGLRCVYYRGFCINDDAECEAILTFGNTQQEKQQYCENLKVAGTCTYVQGQFCVKVYPCENYNISELSNKAEICSLLKDGSQIGCTTINNKNCIKLGDCSSYDSTIIWNQGPELDQEEIQCKSIKSIQGYPCIKDSYLKCRAQICSDNDSNAIDCIKNAPGCIYYKSKCLNKATCSTYIYPGDDKDGNEWCQGIQSIDGEFCAFDDISNKCKDRQCNDVKFYSNLDCKRYKKTCKTNGKICIDVNLKCNLMSGNSEFCNSITEQNGIDKCVLIAPAQETFRNCVNKSCYDNVTGTSDDECEQYLKECVTRGKGCIPNTEPCSSYRGTKEQCEKFKQFIGLDQNNNKIYTYCSGGIDNTQESTCKQRSCQDNTIAQSNKVCSDYMIGCVTKGIGCIDQSLPCTAYTGDQNTCTSFMGSNSTKYCWNILQASMTSSCIEKKCSDIQGKNNEDCYSGMKPTIQIKNFCVFDGTRCIDYGQTCNQFKGQDDEICSNYIARDGPCKVGSYGFCSQRECHEAPNNFKTDEDCQNYHKKCYTTGYGCTSNKSCNNLISYDACNLRNECTWVQQCTKTAENCQKMSGTTLTQCFNTKVDGQQCVWDEKTSTCQEQQCENQSSNIIKHEQCQKFSILCTSTGAGCITMGLCSSYIKKSVCQNAISLRDKINQCKWENGKCREFTCTDGIAQNDYQCQKFSSICRTNGKQCVDSCNGFIDQKLCTQSDLGPCLWINGSCQLFTKCQDAKQNTHFQCQQFSQQCTTNGQYCIPITTCEDTILQESCIIGTNGICVWLPIGKCGKFQQCSNIVSSTNEECLLIGCVSDGTKCIEKQNCVDYLNEIECKVGIDGLCIWSKISACRLMQCYDFKYSSHEICQTILINNLQCTTDGNTCIPISNCQSYNQFGCYVGIDGECILSTDIQNQNVCRLKQCNDIPNGITNPICQIAYQQSQQCVSNGQNCINKEECPTYKNVISCNGGGINGQVCVFKPNANNNHFGTCKLFSACSEANQDKHACNSNKSCFWNSESKCESHTCETFAKGQICRPVPNFSHNSYQICVLQGQKCVPGDPKDILNPTDCYYQSAFTHTWNFQTLKCESCIKQTKTKEKNNNTQEESNNNTQEETNNKTETSNNGQFFIIPMIIINLIF